MTSLVNKNQLSALDYAGIASTNNFTGINTFNAQATFVNGALFPAPNSAFAAIYSSTINADYAIAGMSTTGTATGGAFIFNGYLDCANNSNRYVTYTITASPIQQVGTIEFTYKPNYNSAPSGAATILFGINKSGTNANLITLQHLNNGSLVLYVNDSSGTAIISNVTGNLGAWNPTSGVDYKFSVNLNVTSGATRLFINGVQFGSTLTQTGTRNSTADVIQVGWCNAFASFPSNGSFANFQLFNAVQRTATYTPYGYIYQQGLLTSDINGNIKSATKNTGLLKFTTNFTGPSTINGVIFYAQIINDLVLLTMKTGFSGTSTAAANFASSSALPVEYRPPNSINGPLYVQTAAATYAIGTFGVSAAGAFTFSAGPGGTVFPASGTVGVIGFSCVYPTTTAP